MRQIHFLKLKVLGGLRGLQIKTMLSYTDSLSSWTLLAKAIYMFGCSCPVIGQGAGDEIIAVFITIAMAVSIYIYFLYLQITSCFW